MVPHVPAALHVATAWAGGAGHSAGAQHPPGATQEAGQAFDVPAHMNPQRPSVQVAVEPWGATQSPGVQH
jgi:hypothetical protein